MSAFENPSTSNSSDTATAIRAPTTKGAVVVLVIGMAGKRCLIRASHKCYCYVVPYFNSIKGSGKTTFMHRINLFLKESNQKVPICIK